MNDASSTEAKNKEIEADLQEGLEIGVGGTPNIFVLVKSDMGYRILTVIDGARNEKYFTAVIDQAMKY
jgi:protein-disulfide isomerase